jgi:predicted NBD/HSP70 family sugar kinase
MTVLALDVGGTKIAAALVDGLAIRERRESPTPKSRDAEAWLAVMADLARGWSGYDRVCAAVTGLVRDGLWTALNPEVLPVPAGSPLLARLGTIFGVPAFAANDAQAAALGEYRAARASGASIESLLFVTVSTGIGGGAVSGGRLLQGAFGAAGSVGHIPVMPLGGRRCGCGGIGCVEAEAAGSALAAIAGQRLGVPCDARMLFERSASDPWAAALVERSAHLVAAAIAAAARMVDPERIALGGGIGLRPDYRARVAHHLAGQSAGFAGRLSVAMLGADAGLVGAAAL